MFQISSYEILKTNTGAFCVVMRQNQNDIVLNSNLEILGAARQTWTDDQLINSQLLYHAELGRQHVLS